MDSVTTLLNLPLQTLAVLTAGYLDTSFKCHPQRPEGIGCCD